MGATDGSVLSVAVCLTGRVSVLCVCLRECVFGIHVQLCCWLNLQMRGQQPCLSACAETLGGLQQLGRTILGGTGLYWVVLRSSGQAGGDGCSSHPVAGTILLCKQGFQADAQWLMGSWQDGAGMLPGLVLAAVLFAQQSWLCSCLCWELLLVPLGPLESVVGKDIAGVIAVVMTVPNISAEGFLKTQQQCS